MPTLRHKDINRQGTHLYSRMYRPSFHARFWCRNYMLYFRKIDTALKAGIPERIYVSVAKYEWENLVKCFRNLEENGRSLCCNECWATTEGGGGGMGKISSVLRLLLFLRFSETTVGGWSEWVDDDYMQSRVEGLEWKKIWAENRQHFSSSRLQQLEQEDKAKTHTVIILLALLDVWHFKENEAVVAISYSRDWQSYKFRLLVWRGPSQHRRYVRRPEHTYCTTTSSPFLLPFRPTYRRIPQSPSTPPPPSPTPSRTNIRTLHPILFSLFGGEWRWSESSFRPPRKRSRAQQKGRRGRRGWNRRGWQGSCRGRTSVPSGSCAYNLHDEQTTHQIWNRVGVRLLLWCKKGRKGGRKEGNTEGEQTRRGKKPANNMESWEYRLKEYVGKEKEERTLSQLSRLSVRVLVVSKEKASELTLTATTPSLCCHRGVESTVRVRTNIVQ